MNDYWEKLFSPEGFMPHGHCYLWQPEVLWANVVGDGLTAAAYFAIPITLAIFAKRRPNLKLRKVLWLFAAFILACGTTHIIDIITIWEPTYRIQSIVKIITGFVSVGTAAYLWVLMPVAANLPSPGMFDATKKELRASNQALSEKIRELEIAKRELENFAYTVSHNLRSPIRHLIAYSDRLKTNIPEGTLTDSDANYLNVINTSSLHMGKLVDDLLEYMKTGRMEVNPESVEIKKIIDLIVPILSQNEAKPIAWNIGPLPTMFADERMMRQMWQNLLENAVKFTSKVNKPQISLTAAMQDEGWLFTLSDNGSGFNEMAKEKMFQIFERLHKQSEFSGTGIGLAQVFQIIEKHGGTITAESPEDRPGSVFYIWLPIIQP